MCFEVKVPHGACVLILDCRISWKQWISWLVIIASVFFWFQIIQSWRVLYRFEFPWASLCPRAITFCVRGLASGRPRWASERLECQQTCFIMAPKTGPKKVLKTWLRFRDLDSSKRPWDAQREKGMCWHSCSSCWVANLLAKHLRAATKFSDGWPHFWVQIWTPKWGPELDHISFLLLGLCLGPVLGSRFGPKSGASHRKILLLPADVLQADLRRTSMSVSVNTCFFSLCVPICFLYSRGPFQAAMFLLVFWILFSGPWWSRLVAKH